MRSIHLLSILAVFAVCVSCWADKKEEPAAQGELPGLEVDVENKTITGEGSICLDKGILEYIIVAKGGKEYESIISMDVKPSVLHTAFLMIGGVPGTIEEKYKGEGKGDSDKTAKKKTAGSRFMIEVEWKDGDKTVRVPCGKLMFDREKDKSPEDMKWVFTGSYFTKDMEGVEFYAADRFFNIGAVWYDGSALLNLAEVSKNPYRGDDFGFELNEKTVPEKDTPVKIIFKLEESK